MLYYIFYYYIVLYIIYPSTLLSPLKLFHNINILHSTCSRNTTSLSTPNPSPTVSNPHAIKPQPRAENGVYVPAPKWCESSSPRTKDIPVGPTIWDGYIMFWEWADEWGGLPVVNCILIQVRVYPSSRHKETRCFLVLRWYVTSTM